MARTIIAIYDSYYSASKAARELAVHGFPREMIDITTQPSAKQQQIVEPWNNKVEPNRSEIIVDAPGAGLRIGAGIGSAVGVIGALLTALGALQIPGLASPALSGSLLPLVAVAGLGTLSGGAAGGLLGSLLGLGFPEEEARQYAKNVRAGKVIVTILADWDSVDPVIEILHEHRPLEVQEKSI